MILICYDGSPDAKSAIEHGGALLKGESATVLSVWQPFMQLLERTYLGFGMVADINPEDIDQPARKNAEDRGAEGAELARAAGLDAAPRTVSQETTTAEAILSEAAAVDASAILMGSRGLTGLGSILLGSVSHAVIQHADRAVIVVPSPKVVEERERARSAK
jgi:nucleotide-binding universal stress UspA family protein